MPRHADLKPLAHAFGTPEYHRALARLAAKLRKSGVAIADGDYLALADYAIAVLAWKHEILMPRRARPVGSNRHGPPGKVEDLPP